MKTLIVLAAMFFSMSAHAQPGGLSNVQNTQPVLRSSQTCSGAVSISTATGTPIVVTRQSPYNPYVYVAFDNWDATAEVFCNEKPNVATSGVNAGSKVRAGAMKSWTIPPVPYSFTWYCKSSGAGPTLGEVCKGF